MRFVESDRDSVCELPPLEADVCALLVVQAELACLPAEDARWSALAAQRDRLYAGLAPWQLEQLARIRDWIDALVLPGKQSQAA